MKLVEFGADWWGLVEIGATDENWCNGWEIGATLLGCVAPFSSEEFESRRENLLRFKSCFLVAMAFC